MLGYLLRYWLWENILEHLQEVCRSINWFFCVCFLSVFCYSNQYIKKKVCHKCQNYSSLKHFAQKSKIMVMSLLWMYMQLKKYSEYLLIPVLSLVYYKKEQLIKYNPGCVKKTNIYQCLQNCRKLSKKKCLQMSHLNFNDCLCTLYFEEYYSRLSFFIYIYIYIKSILYFTKYIVAIISEDWSHGAWEMAVFWGFDCLHW